MNVFTVPQDLKVGKFRIESIGAGIAAPAAPDLPAADFLADGDGHGYAPDVDHHRFAARLEIALLVEDTVIGEVLFMIGGNDNAVADQGGAVE